MALTILRAVAGRYREGAAGVPSSRLGDRYGAKPRHQHRILCIVSRQVLPQPSLTLTRLESEECRSSFQNAEQAPTAVLTSTVSVISSCSSVARLGWAAGGVRCGAGGGGILMVVCIKLTSHPKQWPPHKLWRSQPRLTKEYTWYKCTNKCTINRGLVINRISAGPVCIDVGG